MPRLDFLQPRTTARSEDACGRLLEIAARAQSSFEEETAKLKRLEFQRQTLPDNATDQQIRQLVTDIEVCRTRCEMLKAEMQRANVEAEPARNILSARERQQEIARATAEYESAAKLVSDCFEKMQQAERTVKEIEQARAINARTFATLQQELAAKKTRLASLGVQL